jgi:VCBS repeat-containing protein
MDFFGTAGNDNLTGTGNPDTFDVSQGGADIVSGLNNNDIIIFGATFRASDQIHGGAGTDTLRLDGDYSFNLNFAATTMQAMETIELAAGNTYKLTMDDGNVAAAEILTVNGSLLGAADRLIFDGSADTNGRFFVTGGAADDLLTGGGANDTFTLTMGGDDRAIGGGGNDDFSFGGALTGSDRVNGGTGTDTVTLGGDYSSGLQFEAGTMVDIQFLDLLMLHDYKLIFHDGNVAADATLVVTGHGGAGNTVIADGSDETDGRFSFVGGSENDVFIGGAGNDGFNLTLGGDDIARGGLGADTFSAGFGSFTKDDRVAGGAGVDALNIGGDYSAGLKLRSAQVNDIEQIILSAGFSYKFTIDDSVVDAGEGLFVFANTAAGQTVRFNGSAELDGSLTMTGGAGNDFLIGGGVNDILTGGLGADELTGGGLSDSFLYQTAAESTGFIRDTIKGFDALADQFSVFAAVTAVDAEITDGKLRTGAFNGDLAEVMEGLAAGHAVLFTPDDGDLAGRTFLVVNVNGAAGYQNGADLVIEMVNMLNKASFDIGDF